MFPRASYAYKKLYFDLQQFLTTRFRKQHSLAIQMFEGFDGAERAMITWLELRDEASETQMLKALDVFRPFANDGFNE